MKEELEKRVARLEMWANDFSCQAGSGGFPIFTTKRDDDETEARLAALRARAASPDSGRKAQ